MNNYSIARVVMKFWWIIYVIFIHQMGQPAVLSGGSRFSLSESPDVHHAFTDFEILTNTWTKNFIKWRLSTRAVTAQTVWGVCVLIPARPVRRRAGRYGVWPQKLHLRPTTTTSAPAPARATSGAAWTNLRLYHPGQSTWPLSATNVDSSTRLTSLISTTITRQWTRTWPAKSVCSPS